MIDKVDLVELGLGYASTRQELEPRMSGREVDKPSQPVLGAVEQSAT